MPYENGELTEDEIEDQVCSDCPKKINCASYADCIYDI
jgi:hypothetical protein